MNPRVKEVKPLPEYRLRLLFTNGEVRIFDVSPYLSKGVFQELRDLAVFNSVRPFLGSVTWTNGQDICPDTLYLKSISENTSEKKSNAKSAARHASI